MSGKGSKRRISFTDPIHYCLHGSLSSLSFSFVPVQMCSEKKGTRETCHKMCSRKDEKHALIKTCESNPVRVTSQARRTFPCTVAPLGRYPRPRRLRVVRAGGRVGTSSQFYFFGALFLCVAPCFRSCFFYYFSVSCPLFFYVIVFFSAFRSLRGEGGRKAEGNGDPIN